MVTVNGQKRNCEGIGRIHLQVGDSESVEGDAFVTKAWPLGFEFVLGLNGIKALGGVTISPSLDVCFGPLIPDDCQDPVGGQFVQPRWKLMNRAFV